MEASSRHRSHRQRAGVPLVIPQYDRRVAVTKLTISLPTELAEAVRRGAEHEGTSVSGFIAKELGRTYLLEERRQAIAEHEAEHGKLTQEGQDRVSAWLKRAGAE